MAVKQCDYEALLAEYSDAGSAIALLKQYRQYMEMIPSMRRAHECVITLPLPIVRLRDGVSYSGYHGVSIKPGDAVSLPCDLAILMCDPEWKVKTGVEILVFIHRPQEDFSTLLGRWRQSQVWLDKGYEWIMPHHYQHIYGDRSEVVYPLFVLFEETPGRLQRGLQGACLPFVVVPTLNSFGEYSTVESLSNDGPLIMSD